MILPQLFALFLLLIIFAAAVALVIYAITLPLFIQIWVLELFGVPELFPMWTFFLGGVGTIYIWKVMDAVDSSPNIWSVSLGILLAVVGSHIFAGVWAGLKQQHQYYVNLESGFSQPGSLCYDYVSACLLCGNTSPYPDQTLTAIFGAVLFYAGIAAWSQGIQGTPLFNRVNELSDR